MSGQLNSRTLLHQSRELVPCQLLEYKTSSYLRFALSILGYLVLEQPGTGVEGAEFPCPGLWQLSWRPQVPACWQLNWRSQHGLLCPVQVRAGETLGCRVSRDFWEPSKEEARLNAAVSAAHQECLSGALRSGRALLVLVFQAQHSCLWLHGGVRAGILACRDVKWLLHFCVKKGDFPSLGFEAISENKFKDFCHN